MSGRSLAIEKTDDLQLVSLQSEYHEHSGVQSLSKLGCSHKDTLSRRTEPYLLPYGGCDEADNAAQETGM